MKLSADSKWRKTLAWVRREFPVGKPVRIRQVKSDKLQGWVEYANGRFDVRIRKQCLSLRLDTLLHEWAHLLTWFGNDDDQHGSEWGLMYAKLYRSWLTWNYGRGPEDEETE